VGAGGALIGEEDEAELDAAKLGLGIMETTWALAKEARVRPTTAKEIILAKIK
jgi:hypothetical protein